MPAYLVVQITVRDAAAYARYRELVPPTIAAYGGRYLARGGSTETLEGTWRPTRLVIVEFPTAERAREWLASPEYAEAKAIRHASAETEMVLLEGVSPDVPAAFGGATQGTGAR
jgi:uncharacterized protein (DUF1330 family)